MGISDRRPKPSVQDVFATDTNPAPSVMRNESPADGWPTSDVSAERYFSKDWHDREVETVWRKCWQLACREEEIPNVGDHIVYEIVHDSVIVVRTSPSEIRAYVNSCLHRGTLLRTEGGCVQSFRCPFHAWTWSLDGKLVHMHQEWDLEHVDAESMSLPEAQVGTWAGFVFINFDEHCEPLMSYMENLPEHFESFELEKRYKAAHVAKIMPCNWKLAMEAFIEAYHVAIAHPQVLAYYGDSNTQYDVWPGIRHVSRMISVQGVPSPALTGIDPNRTIEEMRRDVPFFAGKPIELEEGDTPRAKLADRAREKISRSIGADMSSLSDTESLDLIEYMLFPNMVPWGGQALPICYRFRPNGDDPETSIMEIMFLFSKAPDGSHPKPAEIRWLGPDQNWSDAPELGSAAMVADQDTENLYRIQKGLRASKKPGVTLAQYQESRIRHFHATLDDYMSRNIDEDVTPISEVRTPRR
jgi:phenylpropionate dioxygenase-like ring-hydroxylating dioxygenase large terminal subunit